LGGKAAAVVSPYAEVGADVDKPEDVAVAKRILGTQEIVSSDIDLVNRRI
jgi:hypothetical protein